MANVSEALPVSSNTLIFFTSEELLISGFIFLIIPHLKITILIHLDVYFEHGV